MSRYGQAFHLPIVVTDYADATGSVSGSSGRRCTRCGCKLRRGHAMTTTHCDPCYAITNPWQPPSDPDPDPDPEPEPGRRPAPWHAIHASAEARRQPGSHWGRTCTCGNPKASGAVMCHTCRYPNSNHTPR